MVPTTADWSNTIGHMALTHFGLVSALFWTPGALKGPVLAPFGDPEVPGGPLEDQIWLQCNYLDTPHGYIPTKNISGPKKEHFGPKLALLGPLGAQKRAETRSKCVVTMSLTLAEQAVAVRTKFCPRGPPGTSGSPKGTFGAKTGPLGAPGVQKRADTRPKCVDAM